VFVVVTGLLPWLDGAVSRYYKIELLIVQELLTYNALPDATGETPNQAHLPESL